MTMLRKHANQSTRPSVRDTAAPSASEDFDGAHPPLEAYDPPTVVDLGHVREVTLGSSSSGNADANSHYYW
ncbi:lasso RiPP family leader peptide-containing protein [Streptomyces apocyni]|uniref:lasso RiPP family leader peptide-containing protein n=1 Tax=Streptomyces apocyni TaxID=2654677 RepID=UPI0012EA20B9